MKSNLPPLFLALAMIGIAALSVMESVPQAFAQFAPFLLLALFPAAWLRRDPACNPMKETMA